LSRTLAAKDKIVAAKRSAKLASLAPKGQSKGSGQPMAPHIQEAIENSLSVDLSSVRLHSGAAAQDNARSLSARAFTFGSDIFLGKGEHSSDLGLIAHEAAHVVQQQAAPALQKWSGDRGDRYEREADQASSAVQRGESFSVRERVSAPRIQRWGLSDALGYFADAANNIPGFRMFTLLIGLNPINMQRVDRNAVNFLRAAIEFIPGGALITKALDKYQILDRVGAWMQEQFATLAIVGSTIKKAIDDFLDSLHWSDIIHLGGLWDRAKHIFTDPIERIKNFAIGLLEGIWKFVRDAILKPIANLAESSAGWSLLTAVLGKNPITGEAVPRTPETLIGGFMKLVHEEEIWENIKRANAASRAWTWFQGALSGLMGFVTQIPSLFLQALKSLEWSDILNLPQGFLKVAGVFGKFLVNFINWAGNTVWDLLQIIFEVVAPSVMPYLKKVGGAFKSILKNPIGFVRNLVKAGMLGFQNFAANFGAHLKEGLIDWLTGSLPGVYIPKAFELGEIVKFVFSVLGLSWQNIRQKLVKVVGEPAVKAMETGFDIVVTLVTQGPAAAWDKIKDQLANLRDMVIGGITDFVVDMVVKKAVPKIVAMFIPGAGFISAILSIYDTIMVFVDKLKKIIQVVTAFVDSIVAIAGGAIGAAANRVESTLAGLLSLAINFLAGFAGLGKVTDKVMGVINKVRAPIDKALDWLINWIVTMAKKLFTKVFGKKENTKRGDQSDVRQQAATMALDQIKDNHTGEEALAILRSIETTLKPKGLKSLQAGPPNDSGTIAVLAEASPARPLLELLDPGFVPKGRSVVMVARLRLWRPVKQEFQYLEAEKSTTVKSKLGVTAGTGGVAAPGEFKKELFIDVVTWNTSNIDSPSTSHAEYQFWNWIQSKKEVPGYLASISAIEVNMRNWSPCGACCGLLGSVMTTLDEARDHERSDPKVRPLIPETVDAHLVWTVLYPGSPKAGVPPTTYDNLRDLKRWQISAPAGALPTSDPHNKEFVKVNLISG
jgi:Domain of unknown function (DUF4157)